MESRRARVRKALGKSILTRSNGSRHLINNYDRTQNQFNNIMNPTYVSNSNNLSNSNNKYNGSSRFLRTLRAPLNAHKMKRNINFLTRSVTRRMRRRARRVL